MKLSQVLHQVNSKFSFPYNTLFEDYPHPFYPLEKIEFKIDEYDKEDFYTKTYSYHQDIHKEVQKALFNFQYEINLCPTPIRVEYVDSIINQLILIYNRVNEKNTSRNSNKSMKFVEVEVNKKYFPLYLFLLDALKNCIVSILNKNENDISFLTKKNVSKILLSPEPILSFQLSRNISDEDLKDSFERRLIGKELIHPQTEFSTFKNLFNHSSMEEKIYWTGPQGALYYFIKQIVEKEKEGRGPSINNPRNKHWKIASEFFIFNDGKKVPNLKYQKPPSQKFRKPIDLFVDDLLSL